MKNNKIYQYKKAVLTNNTIEWDKYRSIRNLYKHKLSKAKKKEKNK